MTSKRTTVDRGEDLDELRRELDEGDFPLSQLERVEVRRPGPVQGTFAVRLPPEVVAEIRRLADERGAGPTQMVRSWILDRLATERSRNPEEVAATAAATEAVMAAVRPTLEEALRASLAAARQQPKPRKPRKPLAS